MTLWEAKIHGKETFSLAYNLRLSIEDQLTGRSFSFFSRKARSRAETKQVVLGSSTST